MLITDDLLFLMHLIFFQICNHLLQVIKVMELDPYLFLKKKVRCELGTPPPQRCWKNESLQLNNKYMKPAKIHKIKINIIQTNKNVKCDKNKYFK
jgi:hypothetical protein